MKLITVTGGVILSAGVRDRVTGEIVGLAAGRLSLISLWGARLVLRNRKG